MDSEISHFHMVILASDCHLLSFLSDKDCLTLRRVCTYLKGLLTERKIWIPRALAYRFQLLHIMARDQISLNLNMSTISIIRFCVSTRHTIKVVPVHGTATLEGLWIYDVMVHPIDPICKMRELDTTLTIGATPLYPIRIDNHKIHIFSYFDEDHPFPASMCSHYIRTKEPAVVTYSVSGKHPPRNPGEIWMRLSDDMFAVLTYGGIMTLPSILWITNRYINLELKDYNGAHSNSCIRTCEYRTRCVCTKQFKERMRQSFRRQKKIRNQIYPLLFN